jgi:hypothetical protein
MAKPNARDKQGALSIFLNFVSVRTIKDHHHQISSLSRAYISSSSTQSERISLPGGDSEDQSNVHIVFIEAKETFD